MIANGDDEPHSPRRHALRHSVTTLLSKIRPAKESNLETIQEELNRLRDENQILKEVVGQLENENDRLHKESASRIILETFEGEGRIRRAVQERKESAPFTLTSEEMLYDDPSLWCDELEEDACPVEPTVSFGEALRDRAYWLVGLLAMQSLSGVILARNEALLANHPVSKSCNRKHATASLSRHSPASPAHATSNILSNNARWCWW